MRCPLFIFVGCYRCIYCRFFNQFDEVGAEGRLGRSSRTLSPKLKDVQPEAVCTRPKKEHFSSTLRFAFMYLILLGSELDVSRYQILCPIVPNNMLQFTKSEHQIQYCRTYYFPLSLILFRTGTDIIPLHGLSNYKGTAIKAF